MAVYLGSDRIGMKGLNAIVPSGYVLPSGTYSISSAGLYDIGSYASVDVDVPSPTGTYSISANGLYDIGSYASVDVTVGATDIEDGLITRTISGIYSNSRITTVGYYAFAYCTNLTVVSLPNVSLIGSSAFASCYNLTTINIPNLTSVSSNVFQYCSTLTSVNFPNLPSSTACYLSNMFGYCTHLVDYNLNFSQINILNGTFSGCSSLIEVSKFSYTTELYGYTFYQCYSLTTVNFPAVTVLSGQVFALCPSLTTVSIPNVQTISGNVFSACRLLSQLSFSKITLISGYAFSGCYNLISLNLTGISSVPILSTSAAFTSTPIGGYSTSAGQYGSIYVPASLYDSFIVAKNWSLFSSRIVSV